MTYKTSIIVSFHNLSAWTLRCIDSLAKYTDLKANQLILLNNGSASISRKVVTDRVKKLIDQGFSVQIKDFEDNNGSYYSWNKGVEMSDSEYLCFLHNDCIVTENWLQPLLDVLDGDDSLEIGCVSPSTNYADENEYIPHPELLKRYSECKFPPKINVHDSHIEKLLSIFYPNGIEHVAKTIREKANDKYRFTTNIATFCFMMRKSSFQKYGPFDEDFYPHLYAEKLMKHKMDVDGIYTACSHLSYVHHNGNSTSDGPEMPLPEIISRNKSLFLEKFESILNKNCEPPYKKKRIDSNVQNTPNSSGKKYLILRPAGLGDVVLSLIAVSSIKKKYPDCSFDMVTISSYKNVPGLFGNIIDRVITLPDYLYVNTYTGETYKKVDDEHGSKYDEILNWMDDKIDLFGDKSRTSRIDLFLKHSPFSDVIPSISDVSIDLKGIESSISLSESSKKIGLTLLSPSPYRSFDEGKIISLANRLSESGNQVILFGPRYLPFNEIRSNIIDFGDSLTPEEQFLIISKLDLLVTVDSGPMHMASVTGTKFVAFFGEQRPELRLSHLPENHSNLLICNRELECVSGECNGCPERFCLNDYSDEFILNSVIKEY